MLPRCPAGSQNEPKKAFPKWYSRYTVFLEKWTPEKSNSRKEKKHENNERHLAWEIITNEHTIAYQRVCKGHVFALVGGALLENNAFPHWYSIANEHTIA